MAGLTADAAPNVITTTVVANVGAGAAVDVAAVPVVVVAAAAAECQSGECSGAREFV